MLYWSCPLQVGGSGIYCYTGVVHFRSEALEYIVIPELSTSGRRLWNILLYWSCPLQVGGSGIYCYTGVVHFRSEALEYIVILEMEIMIDKKYHATLCKLQLLSYYVFTHVFLTGGHMWLPLPCVLGYIRVYPSFLILSPVVTYGYPSTVFLSPMITSGYPSPVFLSNGHQWLPLPCVPLSYGYLSTSPM